MLADALAAACSDPAVLSRIAGPLGAAARAVRFADRADRAKAIAIARAPVPHGLRGVDPTWIEAGLAALSATSDDSFAPRARAAVAAGDDAVSPRARAAVAAGGGDRVATWLARFATAAIPPMPAIDRTRIASIDDATRVAAPVLEAWLAGVGADQLAFALGDAARAAPLDLRAAIARIALPPRAGALGPRRAAIARCRIELGERAAVRIGARAVAAYCDALVRRQLACRLPRGAGVLEELVAHADTPVDQCPRWTAITA